MQFLEKTIEKEGTGVSCKAWVAEKLTADLAKNLATVTFRGAVNKTKLGEGKLTNELVTSTMNDLDITELENFAPLFTEIVEKIIADCPNFSGSTLEEL
jgi:hypothetical protein